MFLAHNYFYHAHIFDVICICSIESVSIRLTGSVCYLYIVQ